MTSDEIARNAGIGPQGSTTSATTSGGTMSTEIPRPENWPYIQCPHCESLIDPVDWREYHEAQLRELRAEIHRLEQLGHDVCTEKDAEIAALREERDDFEQRFNRSQFVSKRQRERGYYAEGRDQAAEMLDNEAQEYGDSIEGRLLQHEADCVRALTRDGSPEMFSGRRVQIAEEP